MSYKYCLVLTVFLILNDLWSFSSECVSSSTHSVIVFLLLVYVYLKLIHNMPSLAVIEQTNHDRTFGEHFHNQRLTNGNGDRFATIRTNGVKSTSKCQYTNKGNVRVEEVKKTFLHKEDHPRHNEQLKNDKCLFTPGKVSEIAEIFQKNYKQPLLHKEAKVTFSLPCKSNGDKNHDSIDSVTQNDNIIEEIETSIAYSSRSDKVSYSWVFGENAESRCDLENILPNSSNDVDFHLGELRSFKQKDNDARVNGILKEVLTCNVIDQKTCDWRSVKKELKSNLEKLKPVAIIDPLTLPATKLNGIENVKSSSSPLYSARNTNATNGYGKVNGFYDEIDSKNKIYEFEEFSCNEEVGYLNDYNGYLTNVYENGHAPVEKNLRKSPDTVRTLSPILEIIQENDNYSSTISTSSDRSSCVESADLYLGSYSAERGESGMNSFCISPEDLYSHRKDEKAFDLESISLETVSVPVSSLEKCTSECQVINEVISRKIRWTNKAI